LPKQASLYEVLMAVVDFVSGMTDNYAVYLGKQFSGMSETRY
jgi:dGTPase